MTQLRQGLLGGRPGGLGTLSVPTNGFHRRYPSRGTRGGRINGAYRWLARPAFQSIAWAVGLHAERAKTHAVAGAASDELVTLPQDARLVMASIKRRQPVGVTPDMSDLRAIGGDRMSAELDFTIETARSLPPGCGADGVTRDGHVFAFCARGRRPPPILLGWCAGRTIRFAGRAPRTERCCLREDDGAHIAYMGVRGESQFEAGTTPRIQLRDTFPFRSPNLRWRRATPGHTERISRATTFV